MKGGNEFFFQAEDGIRDRLVTGVQTCALPISMWAGNVVAQVNVLTDIKCLTVRTSDFDDAEPTEIGRASCRKECRSRWSPDH